MKKLLIFIPLILFFISCGNNHANIKKLQTLLLQQNYYLDDTANDILGIDNLDTIDKHITSIKKILNTNKYQNIEHFKEVKKSFYTKIDLLQRIVSYSAIFNNSLAFVQLHKDKNFYKIINIKSVNIQNELEKLKHLNPTTTNQINLKKHYTILLNYYKDYKYLLSKINNLNTQGLIYNLHYKSKDYSLVYNIIFILLIISLILFIFYKINKSRLKLFVIISLIFLLLSFIAYKVIQMTYQTKQQEYKERFLQNTLNSYHTIYETNQIIANLIFNGYINTHVVKTLLENNKRDELYHYLQKSYTQLQKKYDLSIMEFYKKDTSTFLRMNDPNRYGDKLDTIRTSIDFVHTTLHNYSGYEVGRFKGAFRNIYLIKEKNNILGSVEISLSINFFIHTYLKNHKNSKINFLINGDTLLSSARNLYIPSPIDGFFYDRSVLKILNSHNQLKSTKAKKKRNKKLILHKIKKGKPFCLYFTSTNEMVSIIPIKDKFTNKVVSSIHIATKDNYLKTLQNEFYWIVMVTILSILIVILFIYKQIVAKYDLEIEIAKALEDNTKQLELLEQQSKMAQMGEMIGAIAHQWRQPLNTITTSIQNLKYDFKEGKLNDEGYIKEFIIQNKNTIKFMSKTIDDFRNFFRIDKKKMDFEVKETTQAVVDMQSAQLISKNITLSLTGEEFTYYGLASEYQQVILNLINNAKDALLEKNIKNPMINIHIKDNIITVEDNARGIPDDLINRIFEPYFTTKEQGKGTGMGLYISKMIIEDNMGGSLTVQNTAYGAKFCIDFNHKPIRGGI